VAAGRHIAAELARRDPVVSMLVATHGVPPTRRAVPAEDRFAALVQVICSQQLAGNAARAIHGRLVAVLGGVVTPAAVLARPAGQLAAAGLSGAKVAAVRDLADRVAHGQVALGRIGGLEDEAVVEHLVQVRGVGRWTAEIFLLFSLGRHDVWPVGDLGVRSGYARAFGLSAVPSPRELDSMADRFRPYRSTLAWYCWRVVDDRGPREPAQRTRSRTAPVASMVPELR
jgi:DNA-3-methyladenine glycosylase II